MPVRFIVETHLKDIPSQAVGIVRLVIPDALGVTITGAKICAVSLGFSGERIYG